MSRDLHFESIPQPKLPLTIALHHHAIRMGALSCVYHYVVTPDSVVALRPLTKRTVRDGRRFGGILVGLLGVTVEYAREKLSGLLTQP